MRQVSAALRAAIDAGERIIDSTFTVDWDNDGVQDIDDLSRHVDTLSVNQSLESSLPPQVQLVPGVAVGELTAKIARGNKTRYTVPSFFRAFTTSSVGSGSTPTWSVPKPATAKPGDIILIAVFGSLGSVGSIMSSWQVLKQANIPLIPLSVRGDGTSGQARCEGLLLYRRVDATDPANYTITLPLNSTVAYASIAANIGDQFLMGITDFVQKGEDQTLIPTGITLPQIKVDVPGSTVISFFSAVSYAVSGIGFSPLDPNDVEQTEFVTVATGKPSLRTAVNVHSNAAQGLYQKGVVFTGSSGTNDIATIGFAITLAPKLASDETQHAAWTFSELNPNSPYAGKTRLRRAVRWLLRFVTDNGMETVPLFTGFSTAPSAASDRTATIKALDNRETMRNTGRGIDLAAAYPVSQDFISGFSYPTLPGLDATWIVSREFFLAYYSLRLSNLGIFTYQSQAPFVTGLGYFASPMCSQYAGVWAPMHGSAHPVFQSIGAVDYAYTSVGGVAKRVRYEAGPFVAATKNEGVGVTTFIGWQIGNWQPWRQSDGFLIGRMQAWVRRNQATSTYKLEFKDNNSPSTHDAWVEVLSTGVVRFRVEIPGISRTIIGPTIAADSTWHFLGVHFDSVNASVRFRLDTTNTDVAMTTWISNPITFIIGTADLTLTDGMQVAELQVDGGFSSTGLATGIPLSEAWANENFTPTAFIDKSENLLDVVPYIDPNADSFSIVSAVANAENAAFFFDADGYPHFRTARSDVSTAGQTITRAVTSRKAISQIAYESGVLQVRNMISTTYTPYVAYINKEIFSASGIIGVPGGTTVSYRVTLQGPLITTFVPTYTAYSGADGTGVNLTAQVDVFAVLPYAGTVDVTIRNNASQTAFMVNNSGQANLHMNATYFAPLTGVDNTRITYVDADSIREFGEQPLDVQTSSPWIQRPDAAGSIALKLLSDLCQPRPAITSLTIKGDPTLEFGDLVTVQDPNGIGVNGQYRITGKDPSVSPGDGFTQALVVRSAPSVAYWDTNYWDDGFVWG